MANRNLVLVWLCHIIFPLPLGEGKGEGGYFTIRFPFSKFAS